MKKIASFTVIGILLCVLTVSQAYAGYKIIWRGDYTGSLNTSETTRTEQASIELFNQLFPPAIPFQNIAPYPGGTCFDGNYGEYCDYEVPENCVGYAAYSYEFRTSITMDVCESGAWREYIMGGFIPSNVRIGFWGIGSDVVPDSDGDGTPDESDNCPIVFNFGQEDVDGDGTGDVCDAETVYGIIDYVAAHSKFRISDATVDIYKTNCGGDILVGTPITNSEGYYSFGGLEAGQYLLVARKSGYSFNPVSMWVYIPQGTIQSFDFTRAFD
jgi:hypothetical protein